MTLTAVMIDRTQLSSGNELDQTSSQITARQW